MNDAAPAGTPHVLEGISEQIWRDKYRFNDEASIADSWDRVARALAAAEEDPEHWEPHFRAALDGFAFMPAGRILAGAGTGRAVTLFNCFVMGAIPDDLGGIFSALREAALTLQQGGGIGYDFSTLRPKGAPVRGVSADASGPLSFMDAWDAMCRTIMSAGARRGAMMATLRCDHPDIEDFIAAKRDPARLRMFNLSVLVTDPFMQAVAEDGDWELLFEGTVWRTVNARTLWDRILQATYDVAEPGVIFIDRINRRNNLHYCETISATTPCVAGSTWIQTDQGPRQAQDLEDQDFAVVVDGEVHQVGRSGFFHGGFFRTGRKPVVDIHTVEGYRIRVTPDHRIWRDSGGPGYPGWVAAEDLAIGDGVALQDHRQAARWGTPREDVDGLRAGLALKELSCGPTHTMEAASWTWQRGFLRGLLDTCGTVLQTEPRDAAVVLTLPAWWGDPGARATQRMLLRLGMVSRIEPETSQVVIEAAHLRRLRDVVGFRCEEKHARLRTGAAGARPGARFSATVSAVLPAGEEDVWDVCVPGINAYDGNGFRSHNCGEQPLPPYGACLLGSVNLARFVNEPFSPHGTLDLDRLGDTVALAVRMLDNAIDVSRFPLPEQQDEAHAKRRIGLGVTGLADALAMCGIRYGTCEAVEAVRTWLCHVRDSAAKASIDIAREKGPFPLFDAERYLAMPGVQSLPDDIRDEIGKHGIRNGLLTSIAPTGTISLLADNVSSGIEPIFALEYQRAVLERDGSRRTEPVADHAVTLFRSLNGEEAALPAAFVTAQDLLPAEHIAMQGAAQEFIDSAISKTVNVPESISFEEFRAVYQAAWDAGCKGCTTYRPNPVTGAVLSVEGEQGTAPADTAPQALLERPETVSGATYKMRWPGSDHAIYITVNDIERDGRRVPLEVFINSKNMGHYAWTVALTRMISAVFRRGGDVSFVAEEMQQVFDPRGGAWIDRKYVPSLLAAIGGVIERHLRTIGFLEEQGPQGAPHAPDTAGGAGEEVSPAAGGECPKCGAFAVVQVEGCALCTACGHSECG